MISRHFEPILDWPRTLSCQENSPDKSVGHRGGWEVWVVAWTMRVQFLLTSARVVTSANHLDAQEPHKSHMRVL